MSSNILCVESTHKGVNRRSEDVTQTQQRPESPTVTLTWHASKYNVLNSTRGKLSPGMRVSRSYINSNRGKLSPDMRVSSRYINSTGCKLSSGMRVSRRYINSTRGTSSSDSVRMTLFFCVVVYTGLFLVELHEVFFHRGKRVAAAQRGCTTGIWEKTRRGYALGSKVPSAIILLQTVRRIFFLRYR